MILDFTTKYYVWWLFEVVCKYLYNLLRVIRNEYLIYQVFSVNSSVNENEKVNLRQGGFSPLYCMR